MQSLPLFSNTTHVVVNNLWLALLLLVTALLYTRLYFGYVGQAVPQKDV